ncbi:YeeE/YedE thiosulfate transporter family protein [Anoxybacter fermentans]|nr:YeeE/YedE thiosulfate transporter family protein [Anoxybacter fermentans]
MKTQLAKRRGYLQYQGYFALATMVLTLCVFSFLYYHASAKISVNWLVGIAIGFILDRTRLCFNAALRDPWLYGLARTTKGVLAALIVSTIGFALIQYMEFVENSYILGNLYPMGLNIFVGAVIFGIGAAIAGSCASGTLMRMGEGFGLQWLVFLGLILGSVHGIHDAPWWYKHFSFGRPVIHLPTALGWVLGVGLQIILLILIYFLISWYEKYRFRGEDE